MLDLVHAILFEVEALLSMLDLILDDAYILNVFHASVEQIFAI